MKILLLGEFSSLHKFLKEGLVELGHEVTLASSGDSWKKIQGADIAFPTVTDNVYRRIKSLIIDPLLISREFRDYDVVQFINPIVFSKIINKYIFNYVRKHNNVVSLVAAGLDYGLVKSYKSGAFDYYMFDGDRSMLDKFDVSTRKGAALIENCNYIESHSDVIIPSLYEYTLNHIGNHTSPVIPFPVNTDKIAYKENICGNKVVFFHGLNNEAKKGTKYIKEALERLQANHPDEVEVIIDGHMSFDKYMEVIRRSNVVLDQCLSYGYGINACVSMAQGKIVMSGARKETLNAFGIENCPIIGITPDVDQIYSQLVNILKNKDQIPYIGRESRKYVESLHDYKRVAQQYVDIWSAVKSKKEIKK